MFPNLILSNVSVTLREIIRLSLGSEDLPIAVKSAYEEVSKLRADADKLEAKLRQTVSPELCRELLAYKLRPIHGKLIIQCERVPSEEKSTDDSASPEVEEVQSEDPYGDVLTIQFYRGRADILQIAVDNTSEDLEKILAEMRGKLEQLLKGVTPEVVDLIVMPTIITRKQWTVSYEVFMEEVLSVPDELPSLNTRRKPSKTFVN